MRTNQAGRRAVRRFLRLAAVVLLFSTLAVSAVSAAEPLPVLKEGDRSGHVQQLQSALSAMGYYFGYEDGIFGPETGLALRIFQNNYGLTVDGVVGPKTWDSLMQCVQGLQARVYRLKPGDTLWGVARQFQVSSVELARINHVNDPAHLPVGFAVKLPEKMALTEASARRVQVIPWERARNLFAAGMTAKVTDVKTGFSFTVKRFGGYHHADVEPLSSEQTSIFKKIYGGQWSWNRRAIVVEVDKIKIAASMNGYPHGFQHLTNGFPGHFCIHFLGSRIHRTSRVDKDHQRMVMAAAGLSYF